MIANEAWCQRVLAQLRASDVEGELYRLCAQHHVSVPEVLGDDRRAELVAVRHAYWRYLCLDQGYSVYRIAKWCGVNQSSVRHALKKERL